MLWVLTWMFALQWVALHTPCGAEEHLGAGRGTGRAAAVGGLGTPCACCRCPLACKVLHAWGCLLVTESIGPQTEETAGCIPQATPCQKWLGWRRTHCLAPPQARRLGQVAGERDTHHRGGQTDSGCGPHPASGRGVRRCDAAVDRS